jgi:hypothetical protein
MTQSFVPTAAQIAEHDRRNRAQARATELHPNPDPNAPRICEGCGCTDTDACLDPATGETCFWVEGFDGDICSICFRVLTELGFDQSAVDERAEATHRRMFGETEHEPDERRVHTAYLNGMRDRRQL